MKIGFIILLIFAAIWGEAALLVAGAPRITMAIPPFFSLVLLGAGLGAFRDEDRSEYFHRPVRSLVRKWSLIETALIASAVFLLARAHRPDLVAPTICIIVGLHFLPLAQGIPQRSYFATGLSLILCGLIATLLSAQFEALFATTSAALILWLTSLGLTVQARRRIAEAASL